MKFIFVSEWNVFLPWHFYICVRNSVLTAVKVAFIVSLFLLYAFRDDRDSLREIEEGRESGGHGESARRRSLIKRFVAAVLALLLSKGGVLLPASASPILLCAATEFDVRRSKTKYHASIVHFDIVLHFDKTLSFIILLTFSNALLPGTEKFSAVFLSK